MKEVKMERKEKDEMSTTRKKIGKNGVNKKVRKKENDRNDEKKQATGTRKGR